MYAQLDVAESGRKLTLSSSTTQDCTGDEGILAFEFEEDNNLRECNLFEYLAPPNEPDMESEFFTDLAFSTSLRDYCPCDDDTAVVWCTLRTEASNPTTFFISPPECRQEEQPTLVDTQVCGSAFTTAGFDAYRQYCFAEIPPVQAAAMEYFATYFSTLSTYAIQLSVAATELEENRDEITFEERETLLELAQAAYEDVLQAFEGDTDGEDLGCLEGCAQFVADNCCDDEDFVELEECDLFSNSNFLIESQGELPYMLNTAGEQGSTCNPPKSFPGATLDEDTIQDISIFHQSLGGIFDFFNPTGVTQCVTVRLVILPESCPADSIVAVAYQVPFDIQDPFGQYLGDSGRVTKAITDFSFNLPSLAEFQLVVMQARPDTTFCEYAFAIYQDGVCAGGDGL